MISNKQYFLDIIFKNLEAEEVRKKFSIKESVIDTLVDIEITKTYQNLLPSLTQELQSILTLNLKYFDLIQEYDYTNRRSLITARVNVGDYLLIIDDINNYKKAAMVVQSSSDCVGFYLMDYDFFYVDPQLEFGAFSINTHVSIWRLKKNKQPISLYQRINTAIKDKIYKIFNRF